MAEYVFPIVMYLFDKIDSHTWYLSREVSTEISFKPFVNDAIVVE